MKTLRKSITAMLTLICLAVCGASFAESASQRYVSKKYLAADAIEAFPGWTLWQNSTYGSGLWNDELAIHGEIVLYRISSDRIEFCRLETLLNPLREGNPIPWEITRWAPVSIVPGKADVVAALSAAELFCYGSGTSFSVLALPLLAPVLTDDGETLY